MNFINPILVLIVVSAFNFVLSKNMEKKNWHQ